MAKKTLKTTSLTVFLLSNAIFAGLAIAGCALAMKSGTNKEKQKVQITTEAGYNEYNAEYKKDQVAILVEKFENGEISEYDLSKAVSNLNDYNIKDYMYEYASAEQLEKYEATLKTAPEQYLYFGMFGGGFIGLAGMTAMSIHQEKKKTFESTNYKKSNSAIKTFQKGDFDLEEVSEHLKVTNGIESFCDKPKERDK